MYSRILFSNKALHPELIRGKGDQDHVNCFSADIMWAFFQMIQLGEQMFEISFGIKMHFVLERCLKR